MDRRESLLWAGRSSCRLGLNYPDTVRVTYVRRSRGPVEARRTVRKARTATLPFFTIVLVIAQISNDLLPAGTP
jgi:hypothetical protein